MVKGKNVYVTIDIVQVLDDIKFEHRFKKPSDSIKFLYEFYKKSKALKLGENKNGKIKGNGTEL